jgi:DNA-binding NarL/FixJ family response regulator
VSPIRPDSLADRTIRVLLVDDHPIVRQGLRGMLATASDIDVVGEESNGVGALRALSLLEPDVVLMDLRMPGMDGATATAEIVRTRPSTRVLIVTTYDTDADILRAVEAGATGYVLKDAPIADLVAAVRAASRGETVLAPSVAAKLVRHMRSAGPDQLTAREIEVLACVGRGLSNADIGRELFIGEATVKTHLLRTFAKLGVDDRTAAVTAAIGRGILPSPGG